MTYNQVQWFQINNYANHYVDIKITGYRVLFSESIAGRGVARLLISWLGIAGPIDCINRVFDCYIRVYLFQFLLIWYSQLLVGPTFGYAPEMRHSTNLQDYSHDHAHHLEYGKQYSMIENYNRFVLLQLIIHFHSQSKPSKIIYDQVHVDYYLYCKHLTNFSKCTIDNHK